MKKARILWLVLAVVVGGVLSYVAAQQDKAKHDSNPGMAKMAKEESVTVPLR